MAETAKTNVKWNKVTRGRYTNAPLTGELRKVPNPYGPGETLRFSDEYEDWRDTIGNVEYVIERSETGGKIGNFPVGTWALIIDGSLDCDPFATLADAKAYAEQSIAGGWHK
jgi:hypothetical protein|tara:strand:+ start:1572 stop:1907 length:336 start_codon:yes stop_codon:yes gene_type:complete